MGDKPFLVGQTFTIADCYLFWILMAAPKSGVELPGNLQACLRSRAVQAPRPRVIAATSSSAAARAGKMQGNCFRW